MTSATGTAAPVAVYRIYDADDNPLYYGRSRRPLMRLSQHVRTEWAPDVARVEIEWHPDLGAARVAERTLIARDNPGFNIDGTDRPWHGGGPATVPAVASQPTQADIDAADAETDALIEVYERALWRALLRMTPATELAETRGSGFHPRPVVYHPTAAVVRRATSSLPHHLRPDAGKLFRLLLPTLPWVYPESAVHGVTQGEGWRLHPRAVRDVMPHP